MPSWEDGSERYLAEYRGETIYDAWGGYDPDLSPEGDEMNAYAKRLKKREQCEHNRMVERPDDRYHAWECADCGYIYGEDPTWAP